MACPSPAELAAHVQGSLGPGAAKAIAEHLAGCERCTRAADTLTDETVSSGPRAVPERATAWFEAGAKVGRYVILERLGAGAMGDVYTAYDPELDRKIALKFLRSDVSDRLGETAGRSRL